MTNEEKFAFDLNGFIVCKGYLRQSVLEEFNEAWEQRMGNSDLADIAFGSGDPWVKLLDFGSARSILQTLLGRGFRVDHAYMVNELFYGEKGRLHHQSHMIDQGVLYAYRRNRPYTSLLTISIALKDIPNGAGGFCCVPGSHKSNVDCPPSYFEVLSNPHVVQIAQEAGSAIIFTEALTHGTFPKNHDSERRSILIRLTPGGICYRKNPSSTELQFTPPTHGRRGDNSMPMSKDVLGEEGWRLVMRPPYFVDENGRNRE